MTALNPPSTLEGVLRLPPAQFNSYWKEINGIVATLPTSSDQITAWEAILECLRHHPFSKGMPYFRLGVLRLTRSISNSSTNTWLVGKPSGSLQENATTLSIHAHGQVKFYVIGAKPMTAFYSGLR